ncbi:MAG: ribosomal-processing cysteine protease Prp [Clostridiales bacterium]|nr:ribosomal-processing cysteine protease Prp [Clostridiales bacterium]
MISVIVNREGNLIRAIYANGHAGYDDPGRDIICSSVSTLFYTAANALEDICGYDGESFFRISNEGTEDVNLRITVPDLGGDETKDRAQVIMRTCELGLIGIARDYNKTKKKYVEIIHSRTPEV